MLQVQIDSELNILYIIYTSIYLSIYFSKEKKYIYVP